MLLIPDRIADSVGIYDIDDGDYLGDLLPPLTGSEPYTFESANNAVQGPDGLIYVSDQLTDAIVRFEVDGTYVGVFADAADGLDNVRGIDFRGDELFVSVSPAGPTFVARFDMNGNRLADFVADLSDPFDVLFLPNGTMMLADIADPDNVRLYDVGGGNFTQLAPIDFPQQIQAVPAGNFLVAGWTEAFEFDIGGNVLTVVVVDMGRGIYPLNNGQWLITSGAGVEAINPFSGQVVNVVRVGGSFAKIERAVIPALP